MTPITWILFIMTLLKYCESANILYIEPFTSKSHYIMLRQIGLELARRGHNVTVITANKEENCSANYHEVMVEDKKIWNLIGTEKPNVFTMVDISSEEFHDLIFWKGGSGFTEVALQSKEVQHFLANDNKFDVVICEQFYEEAFYALAHKYSAPLILVTTFGNCMRHNIMTRNPLQLATVIGEFLTVTDPMSFLGRLRNFYFTIYEYVWWKYYYLEKQESLVKKYLPNLPQPVPSLYEIQKNTSLMLVNSHFSFNGPIAYLPNIVEIGGIHLMRSDKALPKDLQALLDRSTQGVVYINFGSNVQSSELPSAKRNALLNVFNGLNQTVLWKWEDEKLENRSDNVVIRNWFPQKEILSHPNIKLFISHGGLIGTQEATFHGIPILGVPIYADQYNNLLQVQELGFGKILQYHDINEHKLQSVIHEMLYNDKYKEKAKELSVRFKDRPMSALDTAMFWIEYVIRHKGADFIKSPALKLNWAASNMLDVYAFVLIVTIACIFVVYSLVATLIRLNKTANIKIKKH